jgi:hypothetical protein
LVPAAKKVKQEDNHPIVINPADIEASSSGYVTPSNIIKPGAFSLVTYMCCQFVTPSLWSLSDFVLKAEIGFQLL